jgi:hypothetical protein
MARSTFEGPILQGNNRFGPLRNVGYVECVQSAILDFSVTTNASAGYVGASGVYVSSNGIANTSATIYTAGAGTVFPPVAVTPTADISTVVYRGCVFYLPYGAVIRDFLVDIQAVQSGGTIAGTEVLIHNGFLASGGTARYFALGSSSTTLSTGRQSLTTGYTATQLNNMANGTTGDIANPTGANTDPNGSQISQVVVNLVTTGTAVALTAGKYIVAVRYTQPDPNIGTQTTYPYGNFN